MLYRSHRGGVYYTPENTIPAFLYALDAGYDYIETDPQLTRDGVVVLMHDGTINRTCRHPDGSPILEPLRVADLSYAELLKFDAGIAMGEQFRGTRIPRLDELLELAQGTGVIIALDKKIQTADVDALIDAVKPFDTKVCFSTSDRVRIQKIQARMSDAAFDYDVNLEDAALEEVCRLVERERLLFWLYMDRPNFAWLAQGAKASPENCARVKQYGRIGIGNICNPVDVMDALAFSPDVIEL
ncbi:MAG: glycerophosphodiester phosphodiesterase family protein [Ruminococcaceae bacterium]|nr:glycerophosphodiester phosphodiesterase family protein [Oscillospiraceae bacterium]